MANERILLVESDGELARNVECHLTQTGYVIVQAVSGAQAVEAAASMHPDLVLMDVHLQGDMDGIETSRLIMERREVPTVFMMSSLTDAMIHRARITNADEYLITPFAMNDLTLAVESRLCRRKMDWELQESEERY
ncbi:MAG: response regulator, partial [Ignavibacteriales bacterium]|nr:response regulator [Ignavibacteriales bacterium]